MDPIIEIIAIAFFGIALLAPTFSRSPRKPIRRPHPPKLLATYREAVSTRTQTRSEYDANRYLKG